MADAAHLYGAVRTPFGRHGGALAGVRPDDLALDAAMQARRAIETGDASLVLVGGVESMSRAPGVWMKPEKPWAVGNQTVYSTALGWRMVNPKMPGQWTISLGESTEELARLHGVSREEQDEFALRSHRLCAQAWDDGFYDWVVPVPGTEWTELDRECVNFNGGAIAIGHPLGASGVRVLATLAYELRARGGGYGVAAICIGVGQGLAVVLHA